VKWHQWSSRWGLLTRGLLAWKSSLIFRAYNNQLA
jgi:hypothetical protein